MTTCTCSRCGVACIPAGTSELCDACYNTHDVCWMCKRIKHIDLMNRDTDSDEWACRACTDRPTLTAARRILRRRRHLEAGRLEAAWPPTGASWTHQTLKSGVVTWKAKWEAADGSTTIVYSTTGRAPSLTDAQHSVDEWFRLIAARIPHAAVGPLPGVAHE